MNFILTHKKQSLFFLSLIIILSFLSFYKAFNFAFIVDDWFQLWGVFYDRSIIDNYIKTQHPNSAYEFLIFAPIFKFSPIYYQIIGFLLKIIDSLFVSLFIFIITKSGKASIYSSLIFAASAMGIETFTRISAHDVALLIPFICLSLYFWLKAEKENSIKKYFFSIIFMILTISSNPGHGIVILPIVFTWVLLNLIQNFKKQNLRKFFLQTLTLIVIPITLIWYLAPRLANRNEYLNKNIYLMFIKFPIILIKFLTSIGNLLIGWIIPIAELNHLSDPNILATISGFIFFICILFLIFKFLRKKSTELKIVLFLSIWILIAFIPGWLTQSDYIERQSFTAVSHRYLAISSIGFIGLIAYLISFVKINYRIPVLTLVIILNIWSSFLILSYASIYRSQKVQNYFYDKIDNELPRGDEKDKIILFLGDHWLRIAVDWNGFYPLAVKREIVDVNDFPIITNDFEGVKNLVCKGDSDLPKYDISNLYSWDFETGDIINVTSIVRSIIRNDETCHVKPT